MDRQAILEKARSVGIEEKARELLDQGYGRDYILDLIFQELGKKRGGSGKTIDRVTDDELVRGLTDPQMLNL